MVAVVGVVLVVGLYIFLRLSLKDERDNKQNKKQAIQETRELIKGLTQFSNEGTDSFPQHKSDDLFYDQFIPNSAINNSTDPFESGW